MGIEAEDLSLYDVNNFLLLHGNLSLRPHSYIRLAAVISYYFIQTVNVMGIEAEDLSLYDVNNFLLLHGNLSLPRTVYEFLVSVNLL